MIIQRHSIASLRTPREGADRVAPSQRFEDANRTAGRGRLLGEEPLLDSSGHVAVVERDGVCGGAVLGRVPAEDVARPLVVAVAVLRGNTVAYLELEGLCACGVSGQWRT